MQNSSLLTSTDIHRYLNAQGFTIEAGRTDRTYAYEHYLGNGHYLYVKNAVSKFCLVIDPVFIAHKITIEAIAGVEIKRDYTQQWKADKNTAYRNFPKFRGEKSGYGYALNISDLDSLNKLVQILIQDHGWKKSGLPSIAAQQQKIPYITTNRIYYGPPGTGKTYALQQLQKNHYTEKLAQQDHETFLNEKLRDLSWREVICLVFLEEKRLLRVPEILHHPLIRCKAHLAQRTFNLSQTIWATLMRHSALDSTTVKYNPDKRSSLALFDKDEAGLWFLLPSAQDETVYLNELLKYIEQGAQLNDVIERYCFVTFHQSYSYEDFIEGLRPVLDDEDNGQIRYEIRQGILVALCERARLDPQHGYALFIDEINRGNVSKIFGELISLIELDKRTNAENALEVTLPYSGQKFSIPANVSIYGSMNSADRSLTPLDIALRRRFDFVEMQPDYVWLAQYIKHKNISHLSIPDTSIRVLSSDDLQSHDQQSHDLQHHNLADIDLSRLLKTMNDRIELLLGRDYLLGHAFFSQVIGFEQLQVVMQQKILPLLQEYFFDDWQKIRLVLNDQNKPAELQFIQLSYTEQQIKSLFGNLPEVLLQSGYRINQTAFSQSEAYITIY